MLTIPRAFVLVAVALFVAACGSSGIDETVRDENGNVIEAGAVDLFSLNTGDCFNELPTGNATTIELLPCAQEHRYEIYELFDIADGDFDAVSVDTAANDGCVNAFAGYMGVSIETSFYGMQVLKPSAGSWEGGDREVVCLASPVNGGTTAGTARGAGLVAEQAIAEPATTTTAAPAETTTTAPAETTTTAPAESTTTTVVSDGSQSVFEINVGDCFVGFPDGEQVSFFEAISCDQPHGLEAIAVFDVDLAAFDATAVSDAAGEGCLDAFEPYMGAAYEVSWYELDWLQPSAGSWDQGDREVICLVFPFDENITQSVGSAQGNGRLLEN